MTLPRTLNRKLLVWYDRARRRLPWRAKPGQPAQPYLVWLSEIMLQQTTVAAVGPYFERFLARFPTIDTLAEAELDEVLTFWSGLGYYARARNLHACAIRVVSEFGGAFPMDEAMLRTLPGIGRYTAAALAAIAFDRPALPVDGNVERVMARLYGIETPMPDAKAEIARAAAQHVQAHRPGDLAQALMDLGATVCTPKSPRCAICPWRGGCEAFAKGIAEDLPKRAPKREKPRRCGIAFFLEREDGAVLFRKRDAQGLLGGLWEIPSTDWVTEPIRPSEARRAAPMRARWTPLDGRVRHSFTHFDLELEIWRGTVKSTCTAEGRFVQPDAWSALALPNLMKKVVAHATAQR